jgi:hypothetical protein
MQHKFIVYFLFISSVTIPFNGHTQTQVSADEIKLLYKLDSISKASSVSSYFATVYFDAMENAVRFFASADDTARKNIRQMEKQFVNYFISSAEAFANRLAIPASWQAYYADTSASPLRHLLLGVNAHLNGDIWRALVSSFSLEEIKTLAPTYNSYYCGLLDIYEEVYREAFSRNRSLKLLHTASLGLDKWYGKILLRRWLKRQLRLATWYYSDPPRFQKKLKKLDGKMNRLNREITRHFR